jgi:hypothetical protein
MHVLSNGVSHAGESWWRIYGGSFKRLTFGQSLVFLPSIKCRPNLSLHFRTLDIFPALQEIDNQSRRDHLLPAPFLISRVKWTVHSPTYPTLLQRFHFLRPPTTLRLVANGIHHRNSRRQPSPTLGRGWISK